MSHEEDFKRMLQACDDPNVADEAEAEVLVKDLKITIEEARQRVKNTKKTGKQHISNVSNIPDMANRANNWAFKDEDKKEDLGEFLREHSPGGNFGMPVPEEKPKP